MEKQLSIPEQLNNVVNTVLTQTQISGFEKAFVMSKGIQDLRSILTSEYMAPIMGMMNTRLGFKTDRPQQNKPSLYTEDQVKECLIEAVFMGLQPYGNEFNIIAGNCYPTKEGMGALLAKINGLSYKIIPQLPRIQGDSCAIVMSVSWSLNNINSKEDLSIPIRVNKMMGTDAIIGKATRKARAWLYQTVTGSEIVDGDVTDVDFKDITNVKSQSQRQEEQEKANLIEFINDAVDLEQLNEVLEEVKKYDVVELFELKKLELCK